MTGREEPDAGVREPSPENGECRDVTDPDDLRARLAARDDYLEELASEAGRLRLAADEARALQRAGEERVRALEEERTALRERVQEYEEERHTGRQRRERRDREVERLRRALERRDEETSRIKDLLGEAEEEVRSRDREHWEDLGQRDTLLEEARHKNEKLERRLRERDAQIKDLQGRLDGERELYRRLAEPEGRLRAGIEAFNESKHRGAVAQLSARHGRPGVRVTPAEGEYHPTRLTFLWPDGDWRTYAAHPGSPVEEPRVYLLESGGGKLVSGTVEPNARLGSGAKGRVSLGEDSESSGA